MAGTYPIEGSNVLGIVLGPSSIKFYDRSTQTITTVSYLDSRMGILDSDSPTAATNTNVETMGYIWRALMTQDPNWQNLVDLSTSNLDFVDGAGTVDHENICLAIIHDIFPDNTVDYWWGPSLFAKYGWFAWNGDTPEMPVPFINYNPCYFFVPYGSFNGFRYAMSGNTTGLASTYSMLDIPFNVFQGETFNTPR